MKPNHQAWNTLQFIDEPIQVSFNKPPQYSKKPGAPDSFTWRGEEYPIDSLILSWSDFSRKGRMARNMRPSNARKTVGRGSWGVGRFYFRVRVKGEAYFDLYYDRAPRAAGQGEGQWILLRRLDPIEKKDP
ncbi:MAG: DUF6504 family protein [Anaerolineales bacterium]|jgi:hypothetical protein